MNIQKLENILTNLNNLEISFIEFREKNSDYSKYNTYKEFLECYFIKKNQLERIYWPQMKLIPPKFIFTELDETLLIAFNQNISISKQINFPSKIKHSSNYYNCVYFHTGNGNLEFGKKLFELKKGDFFIIPPNVPYALMTEHESICIHIMIRRSYLNSVYCDIFDYNPLVMHFFSNVLTSNLNEYQYILFHSADNESIREAILNLFAEYLWGNDLQGYIMECYLKLIFAYLLQLDTSNIDTSEKCSNLDFHYRLILNYLKQNYQSATLKSTAEFVHFSKQYICRIVKEISGSTFSTLLTEIRIDIASSYLKETTLRLEDIAELTGFSDASHLSQVFKKMKSITPSAYRLSTKDTIKNVKI